LELTPQEGHPAPAPAQRQNPGIDGSRVVGVPNADYLGDRPGSNPDWSTRAILAESQCSVLQAEVEKLRADLAAKLVELHDTARRVGELNLELHHERAAHRLVPAHVELRLLPGDPSDLDELRHEGGGQ